MAYPTNVNFKGTSTTIGGQAPSTAQTTQLMPGICCKEHWSSSREREAFRLQASRTQAGTYINCV